MIKLTSRNSILTFFVLLSIGTALFTGCTIKLISDYDEYTDRAVAELHRSVESLLMNIDKSIGTENFSYKFFEDKYDDIRNILASLQIRALARPLNDIQSEQFVNLIEQINMLEEAHRSDDGIIKEEIPIFRSGFNQSFEAIIKLELAKKRGE